MYCGNCGKKLNDNARFCPYCGEKTDYVEKTSVTPNIQEVSYDPQRITPNMIDAGVEDNANRLNVKIIVLAIVIIAIVAGAVVFITQKNNKDNTEAIEKENPSSVQQDNTSSEASDIKEEDIEKTGQRSILDQFLKGQIEYKMYDETLTYPEIESKYEVESHEYRDVDNDDEEELLIFSYINFYPVIVLDVDDGQIVELCSGGGTAEYLTFYEVDGETWVCHSDTSHMGRQIYHFQRYKGYGNIEDDFVLSAEYWENSNAGNDWYDETSDFSYREESISMQEYEELLYEYTGIESHGSVSMDDISINETSKEDFSDVSYASYSSTLGSKNFYFSYPTNVYEKVTHNYDIEQEEKYGTLIESVIFKGAEGSGLEYKMYNRTDGMSKEDVLGAVYKGELNLITVREGATPDLIAPKVSNGYGLSVITGWTEDESKIVYEVIDVEDDYILIMRMVSPSSTEANSVTTELYDRCGFNKTNLWE